tara:strand:+ start:485 stop:859 length:375 start_codon:yes stop_codon:yes gene_type:complete
MDSMDHDEVVADAEVAVAGDEDQNGGAEEAMAMLGGKNRRNKSSKKRRGSRKGGRKSQKQKGGKKPKKTAKKAPKKVAKKAAKKGTKKAPSKWIMHVKSFAKSRDIDFGAAMKHPDCKKTYKKM